MASPISNRNYDLNIQNGKNQGAAKFSVKTPFGEVKVLHNKDELIQFIHQQKEQIRNFNPPKESPKHKAIQEMSDNLNAVTSKIENVLIHHETFEHLAKVTDEGRLSSNERTFYAKILAEDMHSIADKYHSKQLQGLLNKQLTEPVQAHQLFLMRRTLQVILDLEDVHSLEGLHALYVLSQGIDPAPITAGDSKKDEAEFRAGLNTFIHFVIGSRAIDLLVPEDQFPMEHHVLKEFYNDESHPMDLQRFLRTEDRARDVTTVLKNLSQAMNSETIKNHDVFNGNFADNFNPFITKIIQTRPKSEAKTLLDIETVEPQVPQLRVNQTSYYKERIGIEDTKVQENYTFSTTQEKKGIYLYPEGEEPEGMKRDIKTKFMEDKSNNAVYLRVPDADNRVVRMSSEGWNSLKKVQKRNADDLIEVRNRLATFFEDEPSIKVTGRTKSTLGILDKTGRLCKLTQSNPEMLNKYDTIRDIIDINGMRITCNDSSELSSAIEKLKKEGFEFLELDNKYNTIRKKGDYKIIPTTVRDPVTKCVFELQFTTLSSLSISDLEHNIIFKKEAIGLPLTDEERNWVARLSKFSAVTETLNLIMGTPIPLTKIIAKSTLATLTSRVEQYLNLKGEPYEY